MVKGVILAMRAASNARDVNCVVFTGAGDKAFCTGGNTKEYAEYYAGHPQEYRQYMRLFNDMVSAILACDKPVICRVNGMRIGGGQEIGMACDFSVAQDLARFGQAGPKHGSAPIGGATDFLPVAVGAERAMAACVLCEPFSAHKAYQMGILTDIVPALKVDGKFVANPLVETQRLFDEFGRNAYGEPKTGDALTEGKALMKRGTVDLSMLDAKVEELCAKILLTFPDCTTKTLEELRKPKLEAWNRNKEDSRAWLALNMVTEARSGFTAFNEGPKDDREVDFVLLRQKLAAGQSWVGPLHDEIQPGAGEPWLNSPVKAWLERDGALLRLRLARPKANIVDAAMIAALHAALDAHRGHAALRGVLLDAEGPHFSFGASVEEHLAERCAAMLASLHALILAMVEFPVPILVAVRGQCLGGGLEIALAGGPIFAAPDAQFGQPEIKLGVFAPAASCLLPWRVSPVAAEDLLCSGRSDRRQHGAGAGPGADAGRRPRSRRAGLFRRAPGAAQRRRAGLRRGRGARTARCASCANGWPRSSACTSTA